MNKSTITSKKLNYIIKPATNIYKSEYGGGNTVCGPGLDATPRSGCCNK